MRQNDKNISINENCFFNYSICILFYHFPPELLHANMQCPPAPKKSMSSVSRAGLYMRAPAAPMKKKPAMESRSRVTKPSTLVFEPAFIQANRERDMAPAGACPQPPKLFKVARFNTIDPKKVRAITLAKVENYKSKHPNDLRRQVLLAGKPLAFFNDPTNAVYIK